MSSLKYSFTTKQYKSEEQMRKLFCQVFQTAQIEIKVFKKNNYIHISVFKI